MGDELPANLADNWDLHAVVNSFSAKNYTPPQNNTTTTATAAVAATADESSSDPLAFLANMKFDEDEDDHDLFSFPILLENNNNNNINGFDELQDSYKPFFPTSSFFIPEQQLINTSTVSPMNSSIPPPFVFGEENNRHTQQTHHLQQALQQQKPLILQQQQQQPQPQPMTMSSVIPAPPMMPSQAPRPRKRKTPIKKMVCQVKLEHLSVDTWGWRKYGQKPIKGSPYPRNYYRCSSSKGCGARKQVERSNTDPSTYIVSYTGDHSHPRPTQRNSLAGSTRNKFTRTKPALSPTNIAADSSSSSSHLAAACQSPTTSPQPAPAVVLEEMNDDSIEQEEEEDVDDLFEDILIPNLAAPAIDEDFFKGLKHFGTNAASGSGGNDSL